MKSDIRIRPVCLTTVVAVLLLSTLSVGWAGERAVWEDTPLAGIAPLVEGHCFDCHDDTAKGGLNLQALAWHPKDARSLETWIKIHDRVASGEMPPQSKDLPMDKREALLAVLDEALFAADMAEVRAKGRGPLRRLTREEYENKLRHLLELPHLDIVD